MLKSLKIACRPLQQQWPPSTIEELRNIVFAIIVISEMFTEFKCIARVILSHGKLCDVTNPSAEGRIQLPEWWGTPLLHM